MSKKQIGEWGGGENFSRTEPTVNHRMWKTANMTMVPV